MTESGEKMARKNQKHLFCFGFGYVADALARRLDGSQWRLSGSSRDRAAVARIARRGIAGHFFEGGAPMAEAARNLAGATHILISIPPGRAGDPVLRHHARDIAELEQLQWLGYLSTTGVYGDRGGDWVDETSTPAPTTDRGRDRLAAERRWLELLRGDGVPVHIFRLAGIYGSGRSQLDTLKAGTARRIVKQDQVFSRIHIDDLARILLASIERPDPGAIYNVCDDEAAPPQDVVAFAARLLNVAAPPLEDFGQAALSPMGRSFFAENKRVRNQRIKTELGIELHYPSYREGLRALAEKSAGSSSLDPL